MGAASRPEAIGGVQTVLRVDGFHPLADGVLAPRVLARRHPNWPGRALALRDGDPSDRLMALRRRVAPGRQSLEVGLPMLPGRRLGNPLPPSRCLRTLTVGGP